MFIYIASTSVYLSKNIIKIGFTEDPKNRLKTYLTGCPPGLNPCGDIYYIHVWKINAKDRNQGFNYEDMVHNQFLRYRMMRSYPGDSEWFNFDNIDGVEQVRKFMNSRPWVISSICMKDIDCSISFQD